MESIEIKNFGPIRHVKLDLKDINVFIGTTGSGKSTVAKLVAIFRDSLFLRESTFETFISHTVKYNIDYEITNKTYVKYNNNKFHWELKHKNIEQNDPNWLLLKGMNIINEIILMVYGSSSSVTDLMRAALLSIFFSSSEFEYLVKLEQESEKIPEQARGLISLFKEYKEQFDVDRIDSENNSIVVNKFVNDPRLSELLPLVDTKIFPNQITYIPAERNLLSMIGQSIFGLMSSNVSISTIIKTFGSEFEFARKWLKQLPIAFLNAEYQYSNNSNIINLPGNTKIKLEQASSGFQSVIPLVLIIETKTSIRDIFERYFIIEEPELNLYPTVQKDLMDFIIERINKFGDKLIITTHSPYVLTALDNLIQADNTVKRNPGVEEKVKEMVPPERWVDFDRVTCYYFKDGKCRSTLDEEYRSIGPSNIDDVSDDIGKTYDELLALEYANVS